MTDLRREPRPAIVTGDVAMIPLGVKAKDGYALVDADMAWLADKYKWSVSNNGRYAVTGTYQLNRNTTGHMFLHRAIVGLRKKGMVDHISRDTLDNRRCNLRMVDNRINQINTAPRGGTSQYRGVFATKHSTWIAQIKNYQKIIRIGTFKNEIDAAKAYNKVAKKLFGKYAVLNDV